MNLEEGAVAVENLAKRIESLNTPPPELMPEVLNIARTMLIDRTLDHKDKYGNQFVEYSHTPLYIDDKDPYYGRAQASGGEQKKHSIFFKDGYYQFKSGGIGGPEPNLYVLGDMMAAIADEVIDPAHGRLFFIDKKMEERAAAHEYGDKNVPARPWFGVGLIPDELYRLQEIVATRMKDFVLKVINGKA